MNFNILRYPDEPTGGDAGMDNWDPYEGGDPPQEPQPVQREAQPPQRDEPATNRGGGGIPRRATDDLTPVAPQEPVTPTAPQPPSPQFARELVDAMKSAGVFPAPQEAPQLRMSPEEFNQKYNVFTPGEQHVAAILAGGPNAVAALDTVVQSAVLQAVTMMQDYTKTNIERVRGEITPLRQVQSAQQEAVLRDKFYNIHPDLKPYDKMLGLHVERARAQGMRFQNEQQAFDYFNGQARETLKAMGITPTASPSGANGNPNPPRRRMAPMSMGGTPAGDGGGARQQTGSKIARQLWGS